MNIASGAAIDRSMRANPLDGRLAPAEGLPAPDTGVVLDCTGTARFGLRGPGTLDWLASVGITAPEPVNTATILPCGTAVLRLGNQEVLLLAPPGDSGGRLHELRAAWEESALDSKGYDAFREEGWAWFLISGPAVEQLMARISMTDLRLRSVPCGKVLQTRALHQDVVMVRLDRFGAPSYEVFLDIASAEFVLEVLQHTVAGLAAPFDIAALAPSAGSWGA